MISNAKLERGHCLRPRSCFEAASFFQGLPDSSSQKDHKDEKGSGVFFGYVFGSAARSSLEKDSRPLLAYAAALPTEYRDGV